MKNEDFKHTKKQNMATYRKKNNKIDVVFFIRYIYQTKFWLTLKFKKRKKKWLKEDNIVVEYW